MTVHIKIKSPPWGRFNSYARCQCILLYLFMPVLMGINASTTPSVIQSSSSTWQSFSSSHVSTQIIPSSSTAVLSTTLRSNQQSSISHSQPSPPSSIDQQSLNQQSSKSSAISSQQLSQNNEQSSTAQSIQSSLSTQNDQPQSNAINIQSSSLAQINRISSFSQINQMRSTSQRNQQHSTIQDSLLSSATLTKTPSLTSSDIQEPSSTAQSVLPSSTIQSNPPSSSTQSDLPMSTTQSDHQSITTQSSSPSSTTQPLSTRRSNITLLTTQSSQNSLGFQSDQTATQSTEQLSSEDIQSTATSQFLTQQQSFQTFSISQIPNVLSKSIMISLPFHQTYEMTANNADTGFPSTSNTDHSFVSSAVLRSDFFQGITRTILNTPNPMTIFVPHSDKDSTVPSNEPDPSTQNADHFESLQLSHSVSTTSLTSSEAYNTNSLLSPYDMQSLHDTEEPNSLVITTNVQTQRSIDTGWSDNAPSSISMISDSFYPATSRSGDIFLFHTTLSESFPSYAPSLMSFSMENILSHTEATALARSTAVDDYDSINTFDTDEDVLGTYTIEALNMTSDNVIASSSNDLLISTEDSDQSLIDTVFIASPLSSDLISSEIESTTFFGESSSTESLSSLLTAPTSLIISQISSQSSYSDIPLQTYQSPLLSPDDMEYSTSKESLLQSSYFDLSTTIDSWSFDTPISHSDTVTQLDLSSLTSSAPIKSRIQQYSASFIPFLESSYNRVNTMKAETSTQFVSSLLSSIDQHQTDTTQAVPVDNKTVSVSFDLKGECIVMERNLSDAHSLLYVFEKIIKQTNGFKNMTQLNSHACKPFDIFVEVPMKMENRTSHVEEKIVNITILRDNSSFILIINIQNVIGKPDEPSESGTFSIVNSVIIYLAVCVCGILVALFLIVFIRETCWKKKLKGWKCKLPRCRDARSESVSLRGVPRSSSLHSEMRDNGSLASQANPSFGLYSTVENERETITSFMSKSDLRRSSGGKYRRSLTKKLKYEMNGHRTKQTNRKTNKNSNEIEAQYGTMEGNSPYGLVIGLMGIQSSKAEGVYAVPQKPPKKRKTYGLAIRPTKSVPKSSADNVMKMSNPSDVHPVPPRRYHKRYYQKHRDVNDSTENLVPNRKDKRVGDADNAECGVTNPSFGVYDSKNSLRL